MSISLLNVDSEVIRAHKRIDEIGGSLSVGFPNYNNAEPRNIGQTYTADTDGYIWLSDLYSQGGREWVVNIDDQELGGWGADAAWGAIKMLYPVRSGSKYICKNVRGSSVTMKWFPAIKYYLIAAVDILREVI